MGVPRLFYWLRDNYPGVLLQLMDNQTFPYKKISVDCYLLDVNALIHPVCQEIFGYGKPKNEKKVPRLLHSRRALPQKDNTFTLSIENKEEKITSENRCSDLRSKAASTEGSPSGFSENRGSDLQAPKGFSEESLSSQEKTVFYELCKVLEVLRQIVRPQKILYLAIDGVAGLSKQNQQKQRRFKSALEKPDDQSFDSSQITTGSEFMYRLSHFVHNFIKKQLEKNNWWKGLEVIFSNEKVAGEGEHKLIRYMAKNPQYSYCVHSPDADLILLTLGLVNNPLPIYIIRENIYDFVKCKYFVVKVNELRSELLKKISWQSIDHNFDKNLAIYDFISVTTLLGNDFLPHIPSLEISNSGLDILMETFPHVTMEYGHFTYYNTSHELCLNMKSLQALFKILALKEPQLLLKKANAGLKFPDTLLEANVQVNENKEENTLDFKKYRVEYNKQRLNNCYIGDVCKEYFKGLLFVLRYYLAGMPDWHWMFPFHHAPLFNDLARYSIEFDGEMKFPKTQALTPFEQLLAVLPKKSSKILPAALRHLVEEDLSPISDFYPEKFEIMLEGKNQEWEAIAILPFVDVNRLKNTYNTVKDKISEEDMKRNLPGKTTKYSIVDSIVKMSSI